MNARTIVRSSMVLIVIAVLAVVWTSWERRAEVSDLGDSAVAPGPGIVSETRAPAATSFVNGVKKYDLRADHRVRKLREIDGDRREIEEFTGNVSLVIYSPSSDEQGGLTETTRLTAHTLLAVPRNVPVEGEEFESIDLLAEDAGGSEPRLMVTAVLPSGVILTSERLRYHDGRLSTDEGVLLRAGGLIIESRALRYNPDTGEARLSRPHPSSQHPELGGSVKLWSDTASTTTAVLGLRGSAGEILYDAGDAELRLRNAPALRFPDAELTGATVVMDLDEGATTVQAITATGNARAVWLAAGSTEDHVASGDLVVVDVVDGEATRLRVTSAPDAPRPRFELGEAGVLRADSFELALGGEGPSPDVACGEVAGSIRACGEAYFFPATPGSGLLDIRADALVAGAAGAAALDASGNVEIRLAGGGEEPLVFRGRAARFAYVDDALTEAEWPAGVRHTGEGRQVSASRGAYEHDTGDWLLDGVPRPRFLSDEFEVEADEVWMRAIGGFDLIGDVDAQLSGDMVRTLGPLFGDVPVIEAAAESLYVSGTNALTFDESARVWEGDSARLLQADEIEIRPVSDELQADGNVFAILANPRAATQGVSAAEDVVVTGDRLMIQAYPTPQLRLVGQATILMEGEGGRMISGGLLVVDFREGGGWDSMEVSGPVVMSDPAGTGKGERLEYDPETGEIVIYAAPGMPATFVNDQGFDIRDREGLRLEWGDGNLRITAMQNGTTQTVRSGQR